MPQQPTLREATTESVDPAFAAVGCDKSAYKMTEHLGIILVASPFDWLFAKGAIASCRHFMPQCPIQLIVDGEIDTTLAEQNFGVQTVRARDIENSQLRRLGFGWGTTKLLAFWVSTTETFLYLDSDAVLWGDLSDKLDMSGWDYVASIRKNQALDREAVEQWFFDVPFVENHFPGWDWRSASAHFFCPGVFAARKGAFEIEEYLSILRLDKRHPGKFKFGDMGFHNLMVFRGAERGSLRVDARDFQVIFPEHPREELQARFAFTNTNAPIVRPGDEQVLHMPDHKPLVDSPACHSLPMTFFRLEYLRQTEGLVGPPAMTRLRQEDANYGQLRREFLRRQRQRQILQLLSFHPGEWARVFRRVAKAFGKAGSQ